MASPPAWSMGKSTRSNHPYPFPFSSLLGNMRASGVPGPGSYEPRLHHKPSAPNYRLGTSSRSGERRSDAPGPGTYNSPGKISVSSPQYSLRFRSPQSVKSFVPGPGTYDATGLRGYDNAPPSFSFRMKTSHPDGKTKVPGPGTYDATSRIQNQTSPSFKMGTSKRDNFYNTGNAPGPGAYTTRPTSAFNRESGPKYGFGTADRDSLQGMSKTLPGPGTYDFKGSFEGSTGKGMSLVPRRPDSALSTAARSPGPGAYNLGGKNYGPSYGMGTSPSRTGPSKESMGVPGPGNYEPRPVSGKQNIKIGTSLRSPLSSGGFAPGPGAYQSPSKVGEGPKYIMNPRREENNSRYGPGPGAYNPNVTLTKDHYPTAKMGSSNRGDFIGTKANPGPGQYDVRGRLGGPHWGFGSEMRGSGVKSNSPGPGTYNMRNTVGDVPQYVFGGAPLKIHL